MSSRLITQGRARLGKANEADPATGPIVGRNVAARGTAPGGSAAGVSPGTLPDPYEASADDKLTDREHGDLAVCEAALNNLRVAAWAAGKALQVIRDARLYRETDATFEEYLANRWDMSRAQAYRLIDAWPLAERLSPMGDTRLNERQVRELLPLAEEHGQDAAVTVYQTVVEADGVQVTAALLHGAIASLPAGSFDRAAAVRQIRAYLQGGPSLQRAQGDPVALFTAETARLLASLQRVAKRRTLKAAAHDNPDAVRQAVAAMRAVLDEIEEGAL